MDVVIDNPHEYSQRVAIAAREGLGAYLDICAALTEGLGAPARDQRTALRELTQTSQELGFTLVALSRTLEELTARGVQFPATEDPRLVLPLVRTIGESLILMRGSSLEEIAGRPLADPKALETAAARPAVAAFLSLAGPEAG